ncbi:MAG: hypothetical protein R6U95_07280 [Bacteroidales bacterium]
MNEQEKIFQQIQKLFDENPESFNIIEEEIDIDLQMEYLKRSKKLHKEKKPLETVLNQVPLLYDKETRSEEKRDILINLADFEEVEAFRAIEAFHKEAPEDMKPWAAMAYRESKMVLESSLLDEKQILISTGLGGKGYKLRFFIVLVNKKKEEYSETQQKLIETEIEYALKNADSKFESIEFENDLAKIFTLIPINISIKETIQLAIDECNQYGNFIDENFLVTNIKKLSSEEIYQVINQKNADQELKSIDIEDSFDENDFDDDFDDFEDLDDDFDDDDDL